MLSLLQCIKYYWLSGLTGSPSFSLLFWLSQHNQSCHSVFLRFLVGRVLGTRNPFLNTCHSVFLKFLTDIVCGIQNPFLKTVLSVNSRSFYSGFFGHPDLRTLLMLKGVILDFVRASANWSWVGTHL